eukprot:scaffold27520_cov125-Skeletonema_dohrnii-CCMP3373.AAC.4
MSDDLLSVSSPDSNVIHQDFDEALLQINDLNRQIVNLDQRNLLAVESMECLDGTIRHQGDVIRDHRLRLTEIESEKESLEAEVQSLQQCNVVLKTSLTEIESEKESLEAEVQLLQQCNVVLKTSLTESESEKESLEAEVQSLKTSLTQQARENAALRQQIAVFQNRQDELKSQNESLEADLGATAAEKECLVQSARNHIRLLEQDSAALWARNETVKVEVQSLLVENSMLGRKVENSLGDCYALQEDCDEKECQLDDCLEGALQEVTARDDEIDRLESEIVTMQEDCDEKERQLDDCLEEGLQEVTVRDDIIDRLESEIVLLRASIRNDGSASAMEGVVSSVTPAQASKGRRKATARTKPSVTTAPPTRVKKQTSSARTKPSGEESESSDDDDETYVEQNKRKRVPFSSLENVDKSDPVNRKKTKRRQSSSTASASDDTASSTVIISNGPFGHLWSDEAIVKVRTFILKLLEVQASLSDPDHYHHLKGLFPFISPVQLKEKETIKALLTCIHPKSIGMIMGDGFDASAIPREVLAGIEKATLNDGEIVPEYQVDVSALPGRHCGKALRHQDDASIFGLIYSGAYVKAHVGPFGEFKKAALSYLKKPDRDDKLAAFLTEALNRHEVLGTPDDADISFLYIGTTSRPFEIRFAEHDSSSSNSLNASFFREFGKTFEFPAVFSVAGNIRMSLTVEAFLAGLIQLSTVRTLRLTNPNASFFLQGCDGSGLTLVNAGKNLGFDEENVVKYVINFCGPRDTLLSGIELPTNVTSFLEYNIEAILDYHASKFDDSFRTLADVKEKLTLANLHSFVGSLGYTGTVANIAERDGTSLTEASSEFGRMGRQGQVDRLYASDNRVPDTTLQCYKCYKNNGTQSLRKLPIKSIHEDGILTGHVLIDHVNNNASCKVCRKKHPFWVKPDRIETIYGQCCISENCFNVRVRRGREMKPYSDMCKMHHLERLRQT